MNDKTVTYSRDLDVCPEYPPGFLRVNIGRPGEGHTDYCLQVDGAWKRNYLRAGTGWAVSFTSGQGLYDTRSDDVGMAGVASLAC